MVELGRADIEQMYKHNVVEHKGELVKVLSCNDALEVSILNITTGKKSVVKFKKEHFNPTKKRIGYVNHNCHALYISRLPRRRYGIGINSQNIGIRYHENERYLGTFHRSYEQVTRLDVIGLSNAANNIYPSLRDALRISKENGGSCAFDRQFAVDSHRRVFFKGVVVGDIPAGYYTLKRIQFHPNFEFLSVLMELYNEKTVRTFEAA